MVLILSVLLIWSLWHNAARRPKSAAALAPPPGVALETDIVFGQGGAETLKLDLTRPVKGKGPFPALVFVHGGGWKGGSRQMFRPQMFPYSRAGIVCISVDYRLAPQYKFPAQLEDVKCAVRWLRANAAKYHIDPNRIGAVGASAGAHLVGLLGTTAQEKQWEGQGGHGEQSSAVCAVIGLAGPYDLLTGYQNSVHQNPKEGAAVRSLLEEFLGGTLQQVLAQYHAASPVNHVQKGQPPFMLVHGTNDTLVPIEQSEIFARKLKASGVDVELIRAEGGTHGSFGKNPAQVLARINAFIRKHLRV